MEAERTAFVSSEVTLMDYLGSLSPAVQRKILCENAGKLYGLL